MNIVPANSIMVDVETLGQDATYGCIQIGAAAFDDAFEVKRTFSMCIYSPDMREDKETLRWWTDTAPARYSEIIAAGQDPEVVWREFLNWLPDGAWLWAKPAMFDIPFVHAGLHKWCARPLVDPRFSRKRVIDMRSWLLGAGVLPLDIKDYSPPGEPERHHDAEYDAIEQVYTIKRCLESRT